MGSRNDYAVMRGAVEMLREFGVPYEVRVVSAHRTPDLLFEYAETAASRGLRVIIAGAGGAAHLPGMVAAKTVVPVLGVPIPATARKVPRTLRRLQCPSSSSRASHSTTSSRRSGTVPTWSMI